MYLTNFNTELMVQVTNYDALDLKYYIIDSFLLPALPQRCVKYGQ